MARRHRRRNRRSLSPRLKKVLIGAEYLFYFTVLTAVVGTLALVALFFVYSKDLPGLESIEKTEGAKWNLKTEILAEDGSALGEFYLEDRTLVEIGNVPEVVQKAMIAVEDERFDRNHPQAWIRNMGIDPIGIARAMLINISRGGKVQGGSTITQQLAKNLFFTRERTIERKIKEMILSYKIEKRFSRDEIMERYLNKIFFGNQAYGIHSASLRYFGVDLSEPDARLSLGQAAMLAGLAKAPSSYAPHRNPDAARARQRIVLGRMAATGYISYDQIEPAIEQFWTEFNKDDVNISDADGGDIRVKVVQGEFFVEYVRQELLDVLGFEELTRGGYKIRTTLRPKIQAAAEQAVVNGLERLTKDVRANGISLDRGPLEGALIAIDHKTGHILAMVGGSEWSDSNQFNRAVQARRQAGSAFKPFVYYTAFANGAATLGTVLRDESFEVPGTQSWTPQNYGRTEHGPVLPRRALARSYNIAAVRMLLLTSAAQVLDRTGRDLGIDVSNMEPYPSLALGAFEVAPIDMAEAYATFANQGIRVTPYPIIEIRDYQGRLIKNFEPFKAQQSAEPGVAFLVRSLLESVVKNGTAGSDVGARIGSIPAAGKTGTTDDYADAWFAGFTPEITAVAWVGFDQRRTMGRGMTGGRAGGRIWADFIKNAYENSDLSAGSFPEPPPNVYQTRICDLTGDIPSPDCPNPYTEYFLAGTSPTEICKVHDDPFALMLFLHGEDYMDSGIGVWPGQLGAFPDELGLDENRRRLQEYLRFNSGRAEEGGINLMEDRSRARDVYGEMPLGNDETPRPRADDNQSPGRASPAPATRDNSNSNPALREGLRDRTGQPSVSTPRVSTPRESPPAAASTSSDT